MVGVNVCYLFMLYRLPIQSLEDFQTFKKNSELNLDKINKKNPFLIVGLSDFNAKR